MCCVAAAHRRLFLNLKLIVKSVCIINYNGKTYKIVKLLELYLTIYRCNMHVSVVVNFTTTDLFKQQSHNEILTYITAAHVFS